MPNNWFPMGIMFHARRQQFETFTGDCVLALVRHVPRLGRKKKNVYSAPLQSFRELEIHLQQANTGFLPAGRLMTLVLMKLFLSQDEKLIKDREKGRY